MSINGEDVAFQHVAYVKEEEDVVLENTGSKEMEVLVLQGKPINEPVVQHGPFVMNSQTEIRQAFADYQRTGFGDWPHPNDEPIFDRQEGRFLRVGDQVTYPPTTKS